MKIITYAIVGTVFAILIGIAVWFSLKSTRTSIGTDVRVCVDVTDKDSAHLSASAIIAVAIEGQSISDPITIHTQTLSNYHTNVAQKFYLAKEQILLGNSFRHKRIMGEFEIQLDTALRKLYVEQSDKSHSYIFVPLLIELNALSESKAPKRILIADTDLQENTSIFSCFNSSDLLLLQKHPEQVEQKLLQGNSAKDLHGITIYIIHASRSEQDDERFSNMTAFYKSFYERLGATIYIQNNLLTN